MTCLGDMWHLGCGVGGCPLCHYRADEEHGQRAAALVAQIVRFIEETGDGGFPDFLGEALHGMAEVRAYREHISDVQDRAATNEVNRFAKQGLALSVLVPEDLRARLDSLRHVAVTVVFPGEGA